MNYKNCEKAGVSAKKIKEYLELFEKNQLSTHSVIIARGDDIIFEKYYAPFDKDFQHRMYSVSKSFVSLAIGFLWQDGIISLDDKIADYFKEETKDLKDENVKNQTIKHMLMMSTAKPCENWFVKRCEDRVKLYFENPFPYSRPSGTIYDYDSSGSFVLGALVERLTSKTLMEYLREKLFKKIGVSDDAYCLKCPGGHSWGDSAILCIPMDLMKTARFVLNGGSWNGEEILSAEYITEATRKQIDNDYRGITSYNTFGYGYQFWRTYQDSFFFNGMGDQLAVCVPHKDMILVYNGDNQGKEDSREKIIKGFFDLIVDTAQDTEIMYDENAHKELSDYADSLELKATDAKPFGSMEEKINNVVYNMSDNPMGITKMQFLFEEDELKLNYTNAQGEKTLYAGRCKNAFSKFPQEGYSDEIGSHQAPGNYYDCAASFGWMSDSELFIKVQIIDKYFGTLEIKAGFLENKLGIVMTKAAEDFLDEYAGFAGGIAE